MQQALTIQQGLWKGRKIYIDPQTQKNSHFTTAMVKKSLTNTLQSLHGKGILDLSNACFLDLFSGSGQMGLEALSMGFQKVVFFELDKGRFSHILQTYHELFRKSQPVHHPDFPKFFLKDAFRFYNKWQGWEEERELVFFLDPPFVFWQTGRKKLDSFLKQISNESQTKRVFLFLQAPSYLEFPDMKKSRLGSNSLFFWTNSG